MALSSSSGYAELGQNQLSQPISFGQTPDLNNTNLLNIITGSADRTGLDNYISSLQGSYTANDINTIAQQLSNNKSGVSFQELQARLGQGVSNPDTITPASPYIAPTGTTNGSIGGVTTAPTVDPNVLAQYDQAIGNTSAGLGHLDNQFASGNSAIEASYQNALNQLLLGKNQGEQTYNTNKHQSALDYVGAKNSIGANAGQQLNGLWRLLGSRGAGGSSAATVAAPQAVARQASLQRSDVSSTNAQNNQTLDTNWGNFLTGYNNQLSSAASQKDQQRQGLEQNISNNRATLLQTLAQLQSQRATAAGGNPVSAAQPYLDQANSALDSASKYTVAPINYQTQAYQAPSLASYNTTPGATASYQNQQTNDYTSPYLQALLGKKQQLA